MNEGSVSFTFRKTETVLSYAGPAAMRIVEMHLASQERLFKYVVDKQAGDAAQQE